MAWARAAASSYVVDRSGLEPESVESRRESGGVFLPAWAGEALPPDEYDRGGEADGGWTGGDPPLE